jgi:hypothetical protein
MADVDQGVLCPIGLVLVQSAVPWAGAIFENHTVLVYSYELVGTELTLHTCDPNLPGRDDIRIVLDTSSPTPARAIDTNGTDKPDDPGHIRGFFRLDYAPQNPEEIYVDDAQVTCVSPPPLVMTAGEAATAVVQATNIGSTTWTSGDGYRLGSQRPQDNTLWGSNRAELPAARVPPSQAVTFSIHVTAPSVPGTYDFGWQMVRESVGFFGTATAIAQREVSSTLRVEITPFPLPLPKTGVGTHTGSIPVTVHATDISSGATVSGTVTLDEQNLGHGIIEVGTDNLVEVPWRQKVILDPETHQRERDITVPVGTVHASGYPVTPINWGVAD